MMRLLIVLGFVTFCAAYAMPNYYIVPYYESEKPLDEGHILPEELIYEHLDQEADSEYVDNHAREKRSFQPGAPNFPMPGQNLPSSVTSNIERQGKNTIATIDAQHKNGKYDIGGTWTKVIRGPGKSKPNWKVGGTYRW